MTASATNATSPQWSAWPSRPTAGETSPIVWPRFTVVTPNFNYASMLDATMRSVLEQNYPNLEYIVIDGGSTDGSVDIIKSHADRLARWTSERDEGQTDAIKKGFAGATGEICGWLNSDDIMLPWTLHAVANIFAAFPDVQWILGRPGRLQGGVLRDVGDFRPYPQAMIRAGAFHKLPNEPQPYGWIQQESCFWRRRLWDAVGGLRSQFKFAADFDLWTRFAAHAELHAVSTPLGGFTMRPGENRSVAAGSRYLDEVRQIRNQQANEAGSPGAKVAAELQRTHKLRKLPIVRSVAWNASSLKAVDGPMLSWDFEKQHYRSHRQRFF